MAEAAVGGTFPRELDAEAIVVGGGPAGATIAAALAAAGHHVVLIDKASFPRHKACSEYVNPGGGQLLGALGVLDEVRAAGAHRLEAMVVLARGGRSFAANFLGTEPGRVALGLTRYRLDQILLERARAAGVTVRERAQVREVIREGERVVGVIATIDGSRQPIRARLVVGADGRNSVVSRRLGLTEPLRWPRRTGLVAHYRGVRDLGQTGELHVFPGGYVGLASLEDGLTNVALVSDDAAVAARHGSIAQYFADHLGTTPLLADRLAGAELVGPIRGVGTMAQRARRAAGDGYLLVGDAAGFLDPFTGDGIYHALRGALLAAPVAAAALRAGDTSAHALAPYLAARHRAFAAKRAVSWVVQVFIHSPPLLDYVAARLDRRGDLARVLTGVVGDCRPAGDALSPRFLARLLCP